MLLCASLLGDEGEGVTLLHEVTATVFHRRVSRRGRHRDRSPPLRFRQRFECRIGLFAEFLELGTHNQEGLVLRSGHRGFNHASEVGDGLVQLRQRRRGANALFGFAAESRIFQLELLYPQREVADPLHQEPHIFAQIGHLHLGSRVLRTSGHGERSAEKQTGQHDSAAWRNVFQKQVKRAVPESRPNRCCRIDHRGGRDCPNAIMKPWRLAWNGLLALVAVNSLALSLRAEVPRALAAALQNLREQRSYSWEIINADPGPVAQSTETRRGRVTMVQQNLAPHVIASLASNGDMLLKRDWPDGGQLDTLVTADGQIVTGTPEGWLTNQEVLTAMADERVNTNTPSTRYQWLRRADRPDTRRPAEELAAAVRAAGEFEVSGDTYVARIRIGDNARESSGLSALAVTLTVTVRAGVVRDYQLTVQGSRSLARAGVEVPLSDDRFVIFTYLPVRKLDVPDEAWAKVRPTKSAPAR